MQIICSRKDVDPECSMTDEELFKQLNEHNKINRIKLILLDDDIESVDELSLK